jgi:hypothetical protein
MRFYAIFVMLGLLVAGCDKTGQQFVGTWQHEGGFSSTLSTDGSFSSSYTSTNQEVVLVYQGTWQAREGELDFTITNVSGTRRHEPVGSVDHMKIVEVDSSHLVLEQGGMTNYLERR